MTEQTQDVNGTAPQVEQVSLDEATLYKLKFFNESAINKKTQADLAVEQFKSAIQAVVANASEDGLFQVTGIDLDKGLVSRVKK